MTPGDPKKPGDQGDADDAASASSAGESAKAKSDLRFTAYEKGGVSVDRDMSGQGHLARGSHTKMSNLRFSVKAQARTERDPELQALREASAPARSHAAPIDGPLVPALPEAGSAVAKPAEPVGFFATIKRLFS